MKSKQYAVLIGEDDFINRLFMVSVMRKAGYGVREAMGGDAVIEELEKGGVSLLLLDYNLPGKNGGEVIRIMREKEYLRHIPVVLISGYDSAELKSKEELRSLDMILTKPVLEHRLLDAVSKVLNKK